MCTVTYIPQKDNGGFVLTSNRDEKSFRPTITPRSYQVGEYNICFPKDVQAGGSWIAANDHGRLCCLLNGAFAAHQKKTIYEQSRGAVLIELASSSLTPSDFYSGKKLKDVESFTIITLEMVENEITHFSEFIWDGNTKYFRRLNQDEPAIWSSVTLYSEEHRKLRKQWFNRFLQKINGNVSPENILKFHSGTHTGDNSINVIMKREGDLKTVSITQVVPENGKFRMNYIDLQNNTNQEIEL
jgi:hypothetical protein